MRASQRLTHLSLSILLLAALLLAHTQYSWAQTGDSKPANEPFQTVQDSRQALSPRIAANKQQDYSLPADTPIHAIILKFHEGATVRLRNGQLTALLTTQSARESNDLRQSGLSSTQVDSDLQAFQQILAQSPILHAVEPLFQQSESELAQLRTTGEAQAGRQLADLNNFYRLPFNPALPYAQTTALIASLNALVSVEIAYAEPPAVPTRAPMADIPPQTPNFQNQQGYLQAAPQGVDALFAWTLPGGKGQGVNFVDVEGGWRTTHEDLPTLFHLNGYNYYNSGWLEHGTGTLGVVGGVENGYGVTGIAPQARIGAESIFQSQASYNIAGAILRAATVAGAGGVILIEVSSIGPQNSAACGCTSTSYSQCFALPEEYWQDRFDAIATATANGVTVVEAAGNGSCQLDHAVYGNAFNRTVRDSGAMMVGGSPSTSRTPIWFTNWGSRIDVHAWAENVVTTGGGHLFNGGGDPNQYYMNFSGTSSASAIVAGVATSVQGVKIASGAGALSPKALRQLLVTTGTPQQANNKNIGPMPNLRAALVTAPSTAIRNGGFEQGRNGDWQEYSSKGAPIIYVGQQPYAGSYLAWLGGLTDEVSTLTQVVTLPSTNLLSLHFVYRIYSQETRCNQANDLAYVAINGKELKRFLLCAANNSGWRSVVLNLSQYAGQNVQLQFYSKNNRTRFSSFFIDEVSLSTSNTQAATGETALSLDREDELDLAGQGDTATLEAEPTNDTVDRAVDPIGSKIYRTQLYLPLVQRH